MIQSIRRNSPINVGSSREFVGHLRGVAFVTRSFELVSRGEEHFFATNTLSSSEGCWSRKNVLAGGGLEEASEEKCILFRSSVWMSLPKTIQREAEQDAPQDYSQSGRTAPGFCLHGGTILRPQSNGTGSGGTGACWQPADVLGMRSTWRGL